MSKRNQSLPNKQTVNMTRLKMCTNLVSTKFSVFVVERFRLLSFSSQLRYGPIAPLWLRQRIFSALVTTEKQEHLGSCHALNKIFYSSKSTGKTKGSPFDFSGAVLFSDLFQRSPLQPLKRFVT